MRQQSSIKTAPATPRCHKFVVSRMDFDQQRLEYRVDPASTILIERDKAFDFPCSKRDTVCQRSSVHRKFAGQYAKEKLPTVKLVNRDGLFDPKAAVSLLPRGASKTRVESRM